jgi:hypothetical protein
MSARLAARFGCDRPVAVLFTGGAGGGGGFPAVARLPEGLVEGAGGGTLRPVRVLDVGGVGAPVIPPKVNNGDRTRIPLATGGLGADGPLGMNAGLLTFGFIAVAGEIRPVETGLGRRAGAGGGAKGAGFGAGISS